MQTLLGPAPFPDIALLVLRLVVGAIFLVHGLDKKRLWKISPPQMSPGFIWLMRLLSIYEPLAGTAVILGLFTRVAATGMAIIMVGAIRYVALVWKMPFSVKEKPGWAYDLLILASALVLVLIGPGAFSLDRLLLSA